MQGQPHDPLPKQQRPSAPSGNELQAAEPGWQFRISFVITPDGAVSMTEMDPSFDRFLGFNGEMDRSPGHWWTRFVPEGDLQRGYEAISSLMEGQVWEGRVRVYDRTHKIRVVHMRSEPGEPRDEGIPVVTLIRDVTEAVALEASLEEARERLALLDTEVAVAMWSTDEALRFTWSAGRALEAIGHEEDSLTGTTFYAIFETEDNGHPAIAAHHRALSGETSGYEVEWGGVTWRALVKPKRDVLGRISGVTGVAIDLADLLRAAHASKPPDGLELPRGGMDQEAIEVGPVWIDPQTFEVRVSGKPVDLTVTEFNVLLEFAAHPSVTFSRERLAERVWGHTFVGDGTSVTMAISRLRDKIEDDPSDPKIIETVRGRGYRLAVRNDQASE